MEVACCKTTEVCNNCANWSCCDSCYHSHSTEILEKIHNEFVA